MKPKALWRWTPLKKVTMLSSISALLLVAWGDWGIAVLHKKRLK